MDEDRARALLQVERERIEAILERHRRELDEATRGDELAALDQHQADEGTETYDRERLEALPAAERTEEEEERFRREAAAPLPDDDDSTPLDWPAEPPESLGDIPLSRDHAPVVDPQEVDDEVRLDMPGEAYPGEGGAPDVGEPAVDDPVVDRRYRPER